VLPGCVGSDPGEYLQDLLRRYPLVVDAEVFEYLVRTYGKRAEPILKSAQRDPALRMRVDPARPEILAEVDCAVRLEQSLTLCDVMLRRTGLGTLGDPGDAALDRICALMADLLGWTTARMEAEKQRYRDKARGGPEKLVGPLSFA
jgi:glycerol-3-phosphate dehydrogenase